MVIFSFLNVLPQYCIVEKSHLFPGRRRRAGGWGFGLHSLWYTADAAHSLGDRAQWVVHQPALFPGFGLRCSVHWGGRDNRREFGGVDVLSVDLKAFNRLCNFCESALKCRWKYLADMNVCVCVSPPIEKEPSSLLCMMRLSTWRVTGEASESEELSRGPSSWKTHSMCWVYEHKLWCVCEERTERDYPHPGSTSVPELICSRKKVKRSFYVIKHSVQIQIPIRPWLKIFNLVIGAAVLYGSELWGLLLQHDWKKYDKYPGEMLQDYSSSTISCR